MEIGEAIERCKQIIKVNNEVIKEARKNGDINTMQLTASLDNDSLAIETLLKYMENSIPVEVVKEQIKKLIDNGYWDFLEERDYETTINILQKLLEKKYKGGK